MGFLQRVYQ